MVRKTRKMKKKNRDGVFKKSRVPVSIGKKYTNVSKPIESIRIRHTELIRDWDKDSSTDWDVDFTIPINPGLRNSFPWLSGLAANFERYKFHHLEYKYVSMQPTTAAGIVGIGPEYDASEDNSAIEKREMASWEGYVSGSIWMDLTCKLKKGNMAGGRTSHFIRRRDIEDTDVKTYDVGRVFFASVGNASTLLGEVYVSYDVTLYNPQLHVEVGEDARIVNNGVDLDNNQFTGATITDNGLGVTIRSGNAINVHEPGNFLVDITTSNVDTPSVINSIVTNAQHLGDPVPITSEHWQTSPTLADLTAIGVSVVVSALAPWYFAWGGIAATGTGDINARITRLETF